MWCKCATPMQRLLLTSMSYFVPSALEFNVGLTHNLSLLIGGAVQCMFFVGSLVPTFFLDKMGRRRPAMWGSLGLAISMMMLSVLLSFNRDPPTPLSTKTSEASIAFFFTYMLIFGATMNCIPWVYVPEILPLHARAKGTAIGISSNWLWVCLYVAFYTGFSLTKPRTLWLS